MKLETQKEICPICRKSEGLLILEYNMGSICGFCQVALLRCLPRRDMAVPKKPENPDSVTCWESKS